MFILYGRPGSASAAVEAVLAEVEAPHEVVHVPRNDEAKIAAAGHRDVPAVEVPTLEFPDGSRMAKCAAILLHLADLYAAHGLAPALRAAERPRYTEWMINLAAKFHSADLRLFQPLRFARNADMAAAVEDQARAEIATRFARLAAALGDGPFLLGEKLSAADIYAAMLIGWAPDVEALLKAQPALARLYNGVASRPAIAPVWHRNGMIAAR